MLILTGIDKLAAHMFIFYYACLSSITPPVAIAAYAAAGIAGSPPMKTGWMATRLGLAAFIVPFMFAYGPELLIGKAAFLISLRALLTALVGVWFLSMSVIGYCLRPMSMYERLAYFGSALLLMEVGVMTDLIGIIIGGTLFGYHVFLHKRSRVPASEAKG